MPGVRQKGLDNMKQISTGAGLLGLGVCMVVTAFIATHRSGGEAFAQGTGTERRVVFANVNSVPLQPGVVGHYAYRMWSDNAIDLRYLGRTEGGASYSFFEFPAWGNFFDWRTVDNGTSGFRPLTDVDNSGEVDGGDMAAVLMDWNQRQQDNPPPPIDCTINAPR